MMTDQNKATPLMSKLLIQRVCAFAATLFVSSTTWAQDSAKNVYQVELVIFERLEQASNQDPETWPKNIHLAYPEHWQYLIDPTEEARRKAEQRAR